MAVFRLFCTPEDFPGGSDNKESAYNAGDLGSIPGLGRSPGEGNGNHSSILAWRIWTPEWFGWRALISYPRGKTVRGGLEALERHMESLGPSFGREESLVPLPSTKLESHLFLRLVGFLWLARPKLTPQMTNRPVRSSLGSKNTPSLTLTSCLSASTRPLSIL